MSVFGGLCAATCVCRFLYHSLSPWLCAANRLCRFQGLSLVKYAQLRLAPLGIEGDWAVPDGSGCGWQAGSAMDEEAALRATTVYLVQRRIDMLPKPLTEDICSLRCNVDRCGLALEAGGWAGDPRRLRGSFMSRAALLQSQGRGFAD